MFSRCWSWGAETGIRNLKLTCINIGRDASHCVDEVARRKAQNSFVSVRRRRYFETVVTDFRSSPQRPGSTVRFKPDWWWHKQCHAQFASPAAAVLSCDRVRSDKKCQLVSGLVTMVVSVTGREPRFLKAEQELNMSWRFNTSPHFRFLWDSVTAHLLPALLVYLNRSCVSYCAANLQLEAVQEVPGASNTISHNESSGMSELHCQSCMFLVIYQVFTVEN